MGYPIDVIDAFATGPFKGNPAAVVHLPTGDWPEDAWMANVAAEMKHAETAFLKPIANGDYGLRWFTPAVEVDLCGHATLASAQSLWSRPDNSNIPQFRFQTRSGVLVAKQMGKKIELDFPSSPGQAVEAPDNLFKSLAIQPVTVYRNQFDYLLEVTNEATVRAMQPDFRLLTTVTTRGVIVTAPSSNPKYDFVSRFFGPAVGIDEDPVTGSAHCFLAPFWATRFNKTTMLGYQASARGGVVGVTLQKDRVLLTGEAAVVLRGELLAMPTHN